MMGPHMHIEHPRITPDFVLISYLAHSVREKTLLNPGAVAQLTGTSKDHWKRLRTNGVGPKFHEEHDRVWYVLADLQQWLGFIVQISKGVEHV